jgi:hypothetical protein
LLTDLVGLIFSSAVITDYDYVFSENGLVAHKNGELIGTQVKPPRTLLSSVSLHAEFY